MWFCSGDAVQDGTSNGLINWIWTFSLRQLWLLFLALSEQFQIFPFRPFHYFTFSVLSMNFEIYSEFAIIEWNAMSNNKLSIGWRKTTTMETLYDMLFEYRVQCSICHILLREASLLYHSITNIIIWHRCFADIADIAVSFVSTFTNLLIFNILSVCSQFLCQYSSHLLTFS